MKMKSLAKAMFLDSIREFLVIFWTIVFPALLLVLFIVVFAPLASGDGGANPEVKYGLYYEEPPVGKVHSIFDEVFLELQNTDEANFTFIKYEELEKASNALVDQEVDLVIHFEEGFGIFERLLGEHTSVNTYDNINFLHTSRTNSIMARDIMSSVIEEINIIILNLGVEIPLEISVVKVGGNGGIVYGYENFIFPSMLILSILTFSLFNLPIGIVDYIEKDVLKKISSAPVKAIHYFFAFMISQFIILFMAMIVLYTVASFFNISKLIYTWQFLGFLLYSVLTTMSLGLLISSFFKKTATLASFSNILFFLTMFLSGMYFEVGNLPIYIRWYAIINPVTYLIDGLRSILTQNPIESQSFLIPALWFLISLPIFIMNQRKVLRYE
ncbi:UNVERIFIED_CONTAM: ABC-2 type transport system permease protein [Acetivibrio alkalicellulosi]